MSQGQKRLIISLGCLLVLAIGVLVHTLNTESSGELATITTVAEKTTNGWKIFGTITVTILCLVAFELWRGISSGRIDWRTYLPDPTRWSIPGVATGRIPWTTVLSVGGCWIVLLVATRYWFRDSAWQVLYATGITMLTIAIVFGILARNYGGSYGKAISTLIFVLAIMAVVKTSQGTLWSNNDSAKKIGKATKLEKKSSENNVDVFKAPAGGAWSEWETMTDPYRNRVCNPNGLVKIELKEPARIKKGARKGELVSEFTDGPDMLFPILDVKTRDQGIRRIRSLEPDLGEVLMPCVDY